MSWPEQNPASNPDELLYWLWLAKTLGPGNPHTGRVLDIFGDARNAWGERNTEGFRALVGKSAVQRANQPENNPENYRQFTRMCAEKHIQILPYGDPDYPLNLVRIPDMPLVLYCTGDVRWLNESAMIGVVGSRKPTVYGLQVAKDFGCKLARNGAVIVSGLADGLDSEGQRAAVQENAPTIAVMGVPIDRMYPASNEELRRQIEKKGCVISEYPPKTEPIGPNGFLLRNRLIAALSTALLVIEAREKSGTMSTVSYAIRYHKPVFAVPGNIYSENSVGTNNLLKENRAKAACQADDLFKTLGIKAKAVQHEKAPLSENERKVLECMDKQKPKGMQELLNQSGLSSTTLFVTLTKLQMANRILALPGKQYILPGDANN